MPAPVSLQLNDAPGYEEFYGFTRPPFPAAPEPRAVYPGSSYEAAESLLLACIRRREPLVTLTGGGGTGKTTLLRGILEKLDATTLAAPVLERVSSPEALLRTILVEFGVVSRPGSSGTSGEAGRPELASALGEFLRSVAALDATCVLVVDDAERLPSDVLLQLAELSADGGRMTVVLAGDHTLTGRLERDDLRELGDRVTTRAALAPLSLDEVNAYVAHRLTSASPAQAPAFEPAALDAVFAHTNGVPRAIDALCARMLALGAQLGVRVIGPAIVEEAARPPGDPAVSADAAAPRRVPVLAWVLAALLLLAALIVAWF